MSQSGITANLGSILMSQHKHTISSPNKYDLGYKVLHWLMAALIFLMFFAVEGFANTTTTDERITMLIGHSSIGTIITMLLIMRITKRFIIKSKRPEHQLNLWQKRLSNITHIALYICMALVPLTGYLTARASELPVKLFATFNLSQVSSSGYNQVNFDALRSIHESAIIALATLIVLHISAALYHKLIVKDQVLASMTRKVKTK